MSRFQKVVVLWIIGTAIWVFSLFHENRLGWIGIMIGISGCWIKSPRAEDDSDVREVDADRGDAEAWPPSPQEPPTE